MNESRKNQINLPYLGLALCILPFLINLGVVIFKGVNCPFYDDWWLVHFMRKIDSHSLRLGDLFFTPINEHILFFPLIGFFSLGYLTGFNFQAYMIGTQVFFALGFLVYLLIAKERERFNWKNVPLAFCLLSLLTFNWRQTDNLLSGFQFSFLMPMPFSLWVFYALERIMNGGLSSKAKRNFFVSAVVSAVVASYSSAMGMMTWPLGACQILYFGWPRLKEQSKFLLAWVLCAIPVWLGYFSSVQVTPSPARGSAGLREFTTYLFMLLGSLFDDPSWSFALGAFSLALFVSLSVLHLKRKTLPQVQAWFLIGNFALATCFLITFGRFRTNLLHALSNRYVTWNVMIFISSYFMLREWLKLERRNRFPEFCLWVLLAVVFVFAQIRGGQEIESSYQNRFPRKTKLINYRTETDEQLVGITYGADYLRERAPFLFKYWRP